MAKVWIIEQGEYSDYRVVGIFSTEERAKLALAALRDPEGCGSDLEIKERELDPGIAKLNEGLRLFVVSFCNHRVVSGLDWDWERTTTLSECYSLTNESDIHFLRQDSYAVWARDPDHATKIAAERHAKWQTGAL